MVVAALAVDHLEAIVADAAVVLVVVVAVDGAVVGVDALSLPQFGAVVALALPVDVGLVVGADGLAESVVFFEAGLAEALVGVAVVVVSGGAVGADSSDADIL